MRLVVPPLEIDDDDPFKNDVLDRKDFGEALLNLVVQSEDELVISLNGNWGEGKTTFVKMWQGMLKKNEVPNIYIDAFSNDYIDDAFLTIASAITDFIKNNIKKNKKKILSEFLNKSRKVGKRLLPLTAKIGIKAASLGAIKDVDIEEFNKIKDDLTNELSDITGDYIEDVLDSHSENVALIESYKKLLTNLPSQIKDNNDKPLVIIIDELDRCKPTFAVEILEKIKHLFSVEEVVFVLVMNREQLEESIKCVYGQNIDSHTYLQKFITFEIKLPKRIKDKHLNDYRNYCIKLFDLYKLSNIEGFEFYLENFIALSNHFNLSLRQLEKVFANFVFLYGTLSEQSFKLIPLMLFICVIKVINFKLFESILNGEASYDDVIEKTKLKSINYEDEDDTSTLFIIEQHIMLALLSDKEVNKQKRDSKIRKDIFALRNNRIQRERVLPNYAERLILIRKD